MREELALMDFQGFWRKLQQMGLNSYEARSYLILVGHSLVIPALDRTAQTEIVVGGSRWGRPSLSVVCRPNDSPPQTTQNDRLRHQG